MLQLFDEALNINRVAQFGLTPEKRLVFTRVSVLESSDPISVFKPSVCRVWAETSRSVELVSRPQNGPTS